MSCGSPPMKFLRGLAVVVRVAQRVDFMNVVEHGVVLSHTAMFIGHLRSALRQNAPLPRFRFWCCSLLRNWPISCGRSSSCSASKPFGSNLAIRRSPLDFVSYPYSHSLVALIAWGLLLGFLYSTKTRDRLAFTVISLLVISHWVLDFITHRPDMPALPGWTEVWPSASGTRLERRWSLSS